MRRLKSLSVASVVLGLAVAACAPMEGRETAGQYVDDASISNTIRADLVKDQALRAFDIHVETMQGVVQLSGFVATPAQKEQAEAVAHGVGGVRNVNDNIIVHPG